MDCWHEEIDHANCEAELMKGASDFLRLWAPRDLEPEKLGLRALRIECSDDIERVKTRLADTPAHPGTGKADAHLRELAGYFFHAAARLSEIRRQRARTASSVPYLRESPGTRPAAQP